MKEKLMIALEKILGVVWIAIFVIGSVTALVAITKLFLNVVGVM